MKIIVRLIAVSLFIVFFDFALKNTDEVVLRMFWHAQAKVPLILLLLGFLVLGMVLGVLAMTATVLRYRRELQRARRDSVESTATAEVAATAKSSAPDALIEQVGL
jgi:putative membrane protein